VKEILKRQLLDLKRPLEKRRKIPGKREDLSLDLK